MKNLSAHQFPAVYEKLGIDLKKLGCIMLDLAPLSVSNRLVQEPFAGSVVNLDAFLKSVEHVSEDPAKFWIKGVVSDEPHVTLLYGLLTPGNESPMRELVPMMLEGWDMEWVEIDHVSFFPSPYPDEPYWCIVAHLKMTDEIVEGNERLKMLPHINTFPGYKAHITIAYIKGSAEERDWLIEELNKDLAGARVHVERLNLGGNK